MASCNHLSSAYEVLHEIEAAKQEARTLIGWYSSEEQKALSQGLIALEDVSELKGPAVGISPTLDGMQRMREEPLSEWEPEEKDCAVIAFKHVCQSIVRRSEILVSTNNNLACNVCFQHSGSEAKAVLLIRDEDPKELEVNDWIPLTKCKSLLRLLPW